MPRIGTEDMFLKHVDPSRKNRQAKILAVKTTLAVELKTTSASSWQLETSWQLS